MGKLEQATRNFGHHVVSGLCPLIQSLYWECHQVRVWHVVLDLLSDEPLPEPLRGSEELRHVVRPLRDKFFSILGKHSSRLGGTVSMLQVAVDFPESSPEQLLHHKAVGGYHFHAPPYVCRVSTMGSMGKRYEVIFSDPA
jgi:hypothetical protein